MEGDTFKVMATRCNECLFSQQRIVGSRRYKQIIDTCLGQDKYFICHKATLAGEDICCRVFFDTFGNDITLSRAAKIFKAVEYVEETSLRQEQMQSEE